MKSKHIIALVFVVAISLIGMDVIAQNGYSQPGYTDPGNGTMNTPFGFELLFAGLVAVAGFFGIKKFRK